MAMTMYMTVIGSSQGHINYQGDTGTNSKENSLRKDKILVYECNHVTSSEINRSTGIPEGGFSQLFTVIKEKDVTSPKLFQLCCDREPCWMEVELFRTVNGVDKLYYSYTLESSYLYKIESHTPTGLLESNKFSKDIETLYFSYTTLNQKYVEGNIEYTECPLGR